MTLRHTHWTPRDGRLFHGSRLIADGTNAMITDGAVGQLDDSCNVGIACIDLEGFDPSKHRRRGLEGVVSEEEDGIDSFLLADALGFALLGC